MRLFGVIILGVLLCSNLVASNVITVSGFVRDSFTKEPLIGAYVYDSEYKQGASTDRFGHYVIQVEAKNKLVLHSSYLGYKKKEVELDATKSISYTFYLSSGIELDEISVVEYVNSNRRESGVVSIPISTIKQLPVVGSEADVLKAMQLMPGVQGGNEGRSSLHVRGGSPDQNLVLLDGASMYYVNHYGNFLSLFHPDVISDAKLYKGLVPARYGGRLSSVLDLRIREGNKKEHQGKFGVGLLSSDILFEGPIKRDTTSYLFSARAFYLGMLAQPGFYLFNDGVSFGYNFYDIFGKISHRFSDNTSGYLSIYTGDDAFNFTIMPKYDDYSSYIKYGWGNTLISTRLNSIFNQKLTGDFLFTYTNYRNRRFEDVNTESTLYTKNLGSSVNDISLKGEFIHHLSSKLELEYGLGSILHHFKPATTQYLQKFNGEIIEDLEVKEDDHIGFESYMYMDIWCNPMRYLTLNLGARYTGYFVENTNYHFLEPRLLAELGTKQTGKLKFSYTENTQAIHLLSYQNIGTPNDIWLPVTNKIKPGISTQWSIGYEKRFGKYLLSIDAYSKSMENLITYKEGVNYLTGEGNWQDKVETDGKGRSEGIEFLLKKESGKTTGWIGYTLSKSERHFNEINNGEWYPYIYDRRHDFSLVVNHKFNEKYSVSGSWVYGSGYPFTLEGGYYHTFIHNYHSGSERRDNPFFLNGHVVMFSSKNGFRMDDYHRLDLSFQMKSKTKRGNDRTWTIGIYNIYNRQNANYYYYNWIDNKDHSKGKSLWQQSGLPIIPSFKYSIAW